jgi:xylulokinase
LPGDPLLAGVDAGTTRIRALIFTTEGRPIAEGSRPAEVRRPRRGWAEHDPEGLWQAACGALHDALGRIEDPQRVIGVAVASVGEAFVALDREGRPTGPTIAWYDERPIRQLEWLTQAIGAERLCALTGLAPDPTFSLCKLLWLKGHAPDALARTTLWLNVAHYLAWRLCGVPTSDLSLASRSLALDLQGRRWAEDLIQEVGLTPEAFAPIRPAGARLGEVTAAGAAASGLAKGCAVGVGGHDHIVGALAVHGLEPGVLFDSMGTAEALTLALDRPGGAELAQRGFSQGVVEVDKPVHYAFGGLPTSGACIEWFRQLFACELGHDQLIAEAESVAPGCEGATFLPDLRGRISPVPDPLARGAWFGLAADTSRAALYRALLEGLAFDARLCVDALTELPGLPAIRKVRAIGGNTRNRLLMRIKASAYARPLAAAEMPEATALGAALLAGLAAGVFSGLGAAASAKAARFRAIEPEPDWTARYQAHYREVYRPAYAALRPLHHAARSLASPHEGPRLGQRAVSRASRKR